MIISSSYSLLFHPYFSLQNLKSTTPFSFQPEENVSFPLGNLFGLGEQTKTNGDNTLLWEMFCSCILESV